MSKPKVTVSCDPVPGLIAGDGYQVYRDGTMIAGGTTPLVSPLYVDMDPSLDWGQSHLYQMSAGQTGRIGPRTTPGKTVNLVDPGDTTAPAAPGQPSLIAVTTTSVTIGYPANTETDLAGYNIERSTGAGSTTYTTIASGIAELSYVDSGLTAGQTYNYRVRAVDTSGNISQPSQIVTTKTAAAPSTPTGLAATTPAPRLVALTWSGTGPFNVYRDGTLIASAVPNPSYSDNVSPGDYVYQVDAGTAPNLSAKTVGVAAQAYGINILPNSVTIPPAKAGTTAPVLYQFQITGRGTFTDAEVPDQPWLTVSPSSGALSDVPITITLSADPTGEPEGTYTATVSFTEAPTLPAAQVPVNTSLPTLSGSTVSGQTLTGNVGSFSGTPTSYVKKFYRNSGTGGAWIQVGSTVTSAATSSTYALTSGDIGYQIRYGVVASNAQGPSAVESFSAPSAAVTAALVAPTNSGLPVVTGSTQQGSALTGTMGTWAQSPTSFAYQWQRETSAGSGTYTNISGASGTSTGAAAQYTSQALDVGLKIRLQVIASNSVGPSSPANSAGVGPITTTTPSLVLARNALKLDPAVGGKVVLSAPAGSEGQGLEPITMGALAYLIPVAGRTVRYNALGLTRTGDPTTPTRSVTWDPTNDWCGWWDVILGPHGATGLPANKWVFIVAGRNNDAAGTIRAEYCDMTTGVWSTLYQNGNTTWSVATAAGAAVIIGGISRTNTVATWSGYWLAGFKCNAFLTDAQIKALVSSQSGVFYVDPADLLAAPSVESVWRGDTPATPIADLKGPYDESSRVGVSTYDAGSGILPLKVS
jgi:hypothetical protein